MPKLIDITGQRFGRLLAVRRAANTTPENAPGRPAWLCVCDCGIKKVASKEALVKGFTKSCGCMRKETTAAKNTTHGMSGTREYNVWLLMNRRCHNEDSQDYKDGLWWPWHICL